MVEYDNDEVIQKDYDQELLNRYSQATTDKIMECINNNSDIKDLQKCLKTLFSAAKARDETMRILGFIILG